MIILGSIVTLGIFLLVGWAVATEMFQHRSWRRRVESGDVEIVAALIEEALAAWRRARPPRGLPANLWAGVQGAQLIALTADTATVSSSAEAEFRTEEGKRIQVASALEMASALAGRLVDMMLYDVPNLRLATVRVDIYTTFTRDGGTPVQEPILTTTADRREADRIAWEDLTPDEVLARFDTRAGRASSGQAIPIELAPLVGTAPRQPVTTTGGDVA